MFEGLSIIQKVVTHETTLHAYVCCFLVDLPTNHAKS
jgi:hypothetical protein